jgi:hypothetical protein
MWMRHQWQFKGGYNPKLAAGAAKQGLGQLGIGIAAQGDDWVLGEISDGLVLMQAMPIGDGSDSHVMVVAAAENEPSLAVCDRLSEHIRGARTL